MRLVFSRDQWDAAADVYDETQPASIGAAGDNRAHEELSIDQGSGDRRVVEFSRQKTDQTIHAASARCPRWTLAYATRGRGSGPRISKMHRMFLVSGRLSRIARTPQARGVHWAALFCLRGGARDASARYGESG